MNFDKIAQYIPEFIQFNFSDTLTTEHIIVFTIGISLLLVGYLLYSFRYAPNRSDKLMNLLESKESVSILMHPDPDPDCMGSAMGLQRLASETDTDTEIIYTGDITHHENRAFRAVLNVQFTKIDSAEDIENQDDVIVVDHTHPRGFINSEEIDPIAIIDHHDVTYQGDSEYVHIEPEIGACSTQIVEYMIEQDISLEKQRVNPELTQKIANALYYGIQTDTQGFIGSGVTKRDFNVAKKLYNLVDTGDLYQIAYPKIDLETFETKSHSFYAKDVRSSLAVSNVGEIDNSDAIPYSAQELCQLEGIEAVVVFGVCDGIVRLSGRTYDARIHMGEVLQEVVKSIEGASAGGHARMGGGQIPVKQLEDEEISLDELKEEIFTVLRGY